MNRVLFPAILALALGLHAQTPPDAAELTKLLKDFLAGASRNDAAMHDRFWADDLIYTSSAGRRMGKGDIMRDDRRIPLKRDRGDNRDQQLSQHRHFSQAQRQVAGGELAVDQNAKL